MRANALARVAAVPRLVGFDRTYDCYSRLVAFLRKFLRPAAALDAFLLKITIEEQLGYRVQLISDGLLEDVRSALDLSGPASVYSALSSGEVDIYPEAPPSTGRGVL